MENSNDWLPVLATLSGAIVAGAISVIIHWLSNKHAKDTLGIQLSEERARWAVEYELERIQKFYATAENLLDAIIAMRIQQAWELDSDPPPEWVLSYNDARGGAERSLDSSRSEVLLLSENVQNRYNSAVKKYDDWFMAKDRAEGVKHLQFLEKDLAEFIDFLAKYYREIFNQRRTGSDVARLYSHARPYPIALDSGLRRNGDN